MSQTATPPRVFISYSWSSPEHQAWVLNFATELREQGVDAVLDKWDLREGQDANAFMEKMVTDPTVQKVILVCDRKYVEKANLREGGVGTEAQIISPSVFSQKDESKFVAVVLELNAEGKPLVPAYYGNRIHVDLSSDDLYTDNFDRLLRWVFDKPVYMKPAVGAAPQFLSEKAGPSLGNGAVYRRTMDAFRNGKENAQGLLSEYLDSCILGYSSFRISHDGTNQFDELVIASIEQFTPHRNELIELFVILAQYGNSAETHQKIHRFFERLSLFFSPPEGVNSYTDHDCDNSYFIIHELFLYLIAVLLRNDRFDFVGQMLATPYIVQSRNYGTRVETFSFLQNPIGSFDRRNQRLKLNRFSLLADKLVERSAGTPLRKSDLYQADFTLFIRSCFDRLNSGTLQWHPETLLHASAEHQGPLEVYARCASRAYFRRMAVMFDIKDKSAFQSLFNAVQEQKIRVPTWRFNSVNIGAMLSYDQMETRH